MSTGVFKMVDGETIRINRKEENNQLIADSEAAKAEYEAGAWLRGRLGEYGDWSAQLDEMFHDFDAWKALAFKLLKISTRSHNKRKNYGCYTYRTFSSCRTN